MIPPMRTPTIALGAFLALGISTLACGGSQKPEPEKPTVEIVPSLCTYATRAAGSSSDSRDLATVTWFAFLLPGYKMSTNEVTRPVTNCAGQPVRWAYVGPECPALEADLAYLPPPPNLSPQDLIIARASQYTRLIWAITDRLSDGQAEGPVALAEFRTNSVEIRALGTLRALPDRARLRLVTLQGHTLLVAEGERCDSSDSAHCYRGTRLMVMDGNRFQQQPLRKEDGQCQEAAFFPTEHTQLITGKDGVKRAMTASGRLDFAPDGIFIHEEVAVRTTDGGAKTPGKLLREARSDRRLRVRAGRLFASDGSLWTRMIEEW